MTGHEQPGTVLGVAVRRKEDRRLLTGQGRFVGDLQLPRMRHVTFLRSASPHARIRSVDAAAARALGGVDAVFTGEDFRGIALRASSALPSYVETGQPALAVDKVRFAGEAIALVVARNAYAAEDALDLIAVDLEPLAAQVCAWDVPVEPVHADAPDNVLLERRFEAGDVTAALTASAVVVRRTLTSNRQAGNPLECRAGVALWEEADRKLTYWAGTQSPHLLRNALSDLLELPESSIRVIAPDVGGGFGTKSAVYPEDVALCLVARRMPGVAIKWVEDRVEHIRAATHARDHRYVLEAGFAADGELLALRADVTCNAGAYSVYPGTAGAEPLMAGGLLTGPYRLANYDCSVRGITTNTAPTGPYRGVSRPATVYAMETLLNDAARLLGLSDVEIRHRNLIGPQHVPYTMPTRLRDESGQYGACLDRVLHLIKYDEVRIEQARRRSVGEPDIGIGIACYNELTGLGRAASAGPRMPFRTGHEAVTVRIDPDGRAVVVSGVTSQGQGLETTLAQIAAEALGVAYDDVNVRIGDTAESTWSFGAFASRQAVIAGNAAWRAANAVREQVLALAAGLLDLAVDRVALRGGHVFVDAETTARMSVRDVARVAYFETNRLPPGFEPGLEAMRFYDPIQGAFAAGAQAGVVEIDRATGELRILDYACVEDVGRMLHPVIVKGQVTGAIAEGIGAALYEQLVYDTQGNLQTTTLTDYLLPTAVEIPDLTIDHLEVPRRQPARGSRRRGGRHVGPRRRTRGRSGRRPRSAHRRLAADRERDLGGAERQQLPASRPWTAVIT